MTLTELEEKVPALKEYTKTMPPEIRSRCTVRTHAAGSIIHQKDMELMELAIMMPAPTPEARPRACGWNHPVIPTTEAISPK